jgi:hypothetical protein
VQHRRERIVLETQRHRISGLITLSRDGYRSRVSDVLNDFERDFLALTEATVEQLDGHTAPTQHPFVAVHRAHIVFVRPDTADADADADAAAA